MLSARRCRYICPDCSSGLAATEHAMSCSGCAATFTIFHGVPLLLPGLSLSPGPVADAEFVREISRIAVPPAEELAHAVLQDLLADGHRLPFADASLDAVVMFATLHHFPQPVQLLRRLAAKLRPGGLICILCEPVGHVTHGAMPEAFKEELLSGICEQALEVAR